MINREADDKSHFDNFLHDIKKAMLINFSLVPRPLPPFQCCIEKVGVAWRRG